MTNLVRNGGFEDDWSDEKSHAVLVCKPEQPPSPEIRDNIFTPPNWITWFYHDPGTYDQPEVRDAWRYVDPRRVRNGEKAILFFTFSRRHWGGFFQQVNVEQGARYKFTAYAHAWSNHGDAEFPHPHDGRWSEGAGYNEIAWAEGTQPHDTGDRQQDAKANFTFRVGIDPFGGTDPMSANVIWGSGFHIYNGYVKQLGVEATAQANTITVFISSKTLWTFTHSDAYFDDAELVQVGEQPETPDCWDQPRVDFKRTYILLPQNVGVDWLTAAALGGHGQRVTLGFSADDAGLGSLTDKTAIVVNPSSWTDSIEDFFATYYPHTEYKALAAKSPTDLGVQLLPSLNKDIALCQRDPRWANDDLGECPGGLTIGQAGCLLCSLGMMLRRAYDKDVTPPILNRLLAQAKVPFTNDADLTNWVDTIAMFKAFDGSRKVNAPYNATSLAAMLADGWLVTLWVNGGNHFVYLDSVNDEQLNVIDPWTGAREVWGGTVVGIRAAHLVDTPPTNGSKRHSKLGPHVLKNAGRIGDYVRSGIAVAKYVGDWGSAMNVADGVLVIGRQVATHDAQGQYKAGKSPLQAAEKFIAEQLETYRSNPHIEYWEGHNEPVWNTSEEMAWYANFEIMRMELMTGLGYKCVIGNFATGTPQMYLWSAFLPAIRAMAKNKAILGLHEYSCPWMWWMTGSYQLDPNADEGDEGWTTLRYRKVYNDYLIPAGLGNTPLVITECGLDALVNPKPPGCKGGAWKQLGGYWAEHHDGPVEYDPDKAEYYFRQLVWYDEELQKDDYVIGATIFTFGSWGTWADFDVAGTAVEDKLIEYAKSLPAKPFAYPDTPPVPSSSILLGFNDPDDLGAGDWMIANGVRGTLCIPLFIGDSARNLDYRKYTNAGIRVIVNLRYSWSTDHGGQGTLPAKGQEAAFIQACIDTIRNSKGVFGWTIGNEPNNPREFPESFDLTPEYVVKIYNTIVSRISVNVRVSPGACDPFYGPDSDVGQWFRTIWNNVIRADFVDVHGYIRGANPSLCWNTDRFGDAPLRWQGLNYLECVSTLLDMLPVEYKGLDVIVSEFNHLWKTTEPDYGWQDGPVSGDVVRAFVQRAEEWNEHSNYNPITMLCIYRWAGDEWAVNNNQHVLSAIGGIMT